MQIWIKLGYIELMKSSTSALSSTKLAHNRTKKKDLHYNLGGNYNLQFTLYSQIRRQTHTYLRIDQFSCTVSARIHIARTSYLTYHPYLPYHFLSVKKKKRKRFKKSTQFLNKCNKISTFNHYVHFIGHAGEFTVAP